MGPDFPDPGQRVPGPGGSSDRAVDPVLRRRLREAADTDGFLRFDRFMEISLYDPGRGFYDRAETRLGRMGDFYTAAHVHRLYGATLAAHFQQVREMEGSPARFSVVEVGPGDGTLAGDIRDALGDSLPGGAGWEYVLVERSAALRSAIDSRLGRSVAGKVPWRFAPSLGSGGPIRGVILANELLDAFPFRRYERSGDRWAEVGVMVPADGPLRFKVQLTDEAQLPQGMPLAAPEGAIVEISQAAEAWMRELADHLVGGRAVLIDYGAEEEILTARRGRGTLEAIRDHRAVDPLSRPGTTDLSAWVNFTRIRRAARSAGLEETFYGPLAEALLAWGVDSVRALREAQVDSVDAVKLRLAQKSFLLGFETFKVLELAPPRGSLHGR